VAGAEEEYIKKDVVLGVEGIVSFADEELGVSNK